MEILSGENWSWRKFFGGIFNGLNYAKALILGLCLAIMLSIAALSVYGVVYLKGRLFPKKTDDRVIKVESQGGAVDASVTTKKTDFTLFKFGGTNN